MKCICVLYNAKSPHYVYYIPNTNQATHKSWSREYSIKQVCKFRKTITITRKTSKNVHVSFAVGKITASP